MIKKVAAFGTSQRGRMKSAVFTHTYDGFALPREPNSGRIWLVPSPIWEMSVYKPAVFGILLVGCFARDRTPVRARTENRALLAHDFPVAIAKCVAATKRSLEATMMKSISIVQLVVAVLLLADPVHAQAAQSCVESAAAATSNHVSTRAGLAIED